ncbi:tRNA(adenine34) deaminase [Entomortierella lignicola]|nr:tRNA(adenine34) deaminase [Entomortierella lignicola]KAF9195659.1 tRNA(adenine34) deaminase [Haplosporangium sp. Z 27]
MSQDTIVQDDGVETEHHKHMRMALDLALEAHSINEVPVGCVFVHTPTGKVIGKGKNRTNESLNGTRHAEFEGIDMILSQEEYRVQTQDPSKNFWKDVTLYVTIEPCVSDKFTLAPEMNALEAMDRSSIFIETPDPKKKRHRVLKEDI